MRVDGENLAATPIERILVRHPDIVGATVYAVPDPQVGDLPMAALELREGATFDPEGFAAFLAEQADLGTKAAPRFVRIVETLPVTATMKAIRKDLRREMWRTTDPTWWKAEKDSPYAPLTTDDIAAYEARFARHGRAHIIG